MTSYEKYAALRDEKGVKDYAVAKACFNGQNAMFVSWKNGVYEPKLDKRLKIADYFGVSIEELIGD